MVLAIAWLCQYIAQTFLGQAVPVPLWACAYLAMHESISIFAKCEALDIIDKPEPKKDDGAFRKF